MKFYHLDFPDHLVISQHASLNFTSFGLILLDALVPLSLLSCCFSHNNSPPL